MLPRLSYIRFTTTIDTHADSTGERTAVATTVAIMVATTLATTVATTVVIDSLCEVTKAGLHERPWLLDIDAARCPLLAQSRHHSRADPCPLLGVKRISTEPSIFQFRRIDRAFETGDGRRITA